MGLQRGWKIGQGNNRCRSPEVREHVQSWGLWPVQHSCSHEICWKKQLMRKHRSLTCQGTYEQLLCALWGRTGH